jgi:hypothetical protein
MLLTERRFGLAVVLWPQITSTEACDDAQTIAPRRPPPVPRGVLPDRHLFDRDLVFRRFRISKVSHDESADGSRNSRQRNHPRGLGFRAWGMMRKMSLLIKVAQKFLYRDQKYPLVARSQPTTRFFAMLTRGKLIETIFFLLFAVGLGLPSEGCYAMAQTQDHFKSITIDEAPSDVAEELRKRFGTELEYQLKVGGVRDDAIGLDLAVVRIESKDCDEKFCPTYIRYTFKGGVPVVQTLILRCEEWLVIGDHFRPITSGTEIVGIAAWIVVKTNVGEALVAFTRLGPEVSFKK